MKDIEIFLLFLNCRYDERLNNFYESTYLNMDFEFSPKDIQDIKNTLRNKDDMGFVKKYIDETIKDIDFEPRARHKCICCRDQVLFFGCVCGGI